MTALQIVTVAVEKPKARRGTTNRNDRGNTEDRRRRREWLVETYRADRDILRVAYADGRVELDYFVVNAERLMEFDIVVLAEPVPTCRCYRCGDPLTVDTVTVDTVTVDRIIPGCKGGTYRRNNIRPACADCNSETGGALACVPKKGRRR